MKFGNTGLIGEFGGIFLVKIKTPSQLSSYQRVALKDECFLVQDFVHPDDTGECLVCICL